MSVIGLTYSAKEIAERYGKSPTEIYSLINSGHLEAIDVSGPGAVRPRWRVPEEALEEFERSRSSRRNKQAKEVQRRTRETADPYAGVLDIDDI